MKVVLVAWIARPKEHPKDVVSCNQPRGQQAEKSTMMAVGYASLRAPVFEEADPKAATERARQVARAPVSGEVEARDVDAVGEPMFADPVRIATDSTAVG